MSAPVDVLLAGARAALSQNATFPADVEMAVRCINDASAAIAELIDRVEARKALRDEYREWSRNNPTGPVPRAFLQRFVAADERVNEALARVQGGAK